MEKFRVALENGHVFKQGNSYMVADVYGTEFNRTEALFLVKELKDQGARLVPVKERG